MKKNGWYTNCNASKHIQTYSVNNYTTNNNMKKRMNAGLLAI